eukprot:m.347227 g.347227  ORF g.347227 m.347227 type:complete len:256 (+) comp31886_c0_seq1:23-790(+)
MTSIFSLRGKTVLVTGASSGLGAKFARIVGEAGAQVAIAARRKDRLETLKQDLERSGIPVMSTYMDVLSVDSITKAFSQVEEVFGVCNVVINNAGVADSKPAIRIEEQSWDHVLDTNLKGAFFVAKEAGKRLMRSKQPGSIINIASILGMRPGIGHASYGSAKAGLLHLNKILALEYARHNIRVNAICPGYFLTEMNRDYFDTEKGIQYIKSTPAGRLGAADELTGPVLLLASDASSYMNGSVLAVDGGHLCSSL